MKATTFTVVKLLMRIVGTLAGVEGVAMLFVIPFILHFASQGDAPWMYWGLIPLLAISAYFLYDAYLVWFRYSPCAVRQTSGVLAIEGALYSIKAFGQHSSQDYDAAGWKTFAPLAFLLAIYVTHRFVSYGLIRWLFPRELPPIPAT